MSPIKLVIYLLAFCGGFIIMSLELLGGRMLAPYFGSGIYVWGSIITVFMLSLSLGYLLGGRFSVHNPSITKFATLFGGAAVLLYPLVYFADSIMQVIFLQIEDPRYGSLVASCTLFIVPTIILGMISPYSVRLLVETVERSGQVAGKLYFMSTVGRSLGTLMTSFYFVLWFEVNTILTLMTVTLLLIAAVAVAADRFFGNDLIQLNGLKTPNAADDTALK